MSGARINRDHRLCLDLALTAKSKKDIIGQLRWLADKLAEEPELETFHIVGDFDEKIMIMHNQQVVPMDQIDTDKMSAYIRIPSSVYEKVKTEYHFRKSMQAFNKAVDDEFNQDD